MKRTIVDLVLLSVGGAVGLCLAIVWASRNVYRDAHAEGWD
jgi:hypothetical protein